MSDQPSSSAASGHRLPKPEAQSRDASFAEANYTQTSDPDIQILESDFVDLENDYYALKNANFDLHEEVQRLTKANDDLETLVDQRSKEKSTLETQQALLQGQLDQAKDEVCDLKIQIQEVENEKNGFQATCLGLKDVKQKLRNVLEEKLKISERMVQLQEEKTKLEQRADLNNQKVEKFSDLHVDLLDSKSKLNEELANLRATSAQESDEYKRVISELQAANEDMKVKIERCDQDLSYSEDRIQGLEAEVEKLKQQSLDQREKHHNEILIREIRWATVEQMVQGLQRENWNLKNAAKSQSMGQEIEVANKRILELEQLSSSLQETHARLTQETSATQAKLEDLQKTEESQAQFQERYKADVSAWKGRIEELEAINDEQLETNQQQEKELQEKRILVENLENVNKDAMKRKEKMFTTHSRVKAALKDQIEVHQREIIALKTTLKDQDKLQAQVEELKKVAKSRKNEIAVSANFLSQVRNKQIELQAEVNELKKLDEARKTEILRHKNTISASQAMIQLLGNTNSSLKNVENERNKLRREVAELTKRTEAYDDKIQSMQRAYQSKNEALKTAKYNCELARIDKDKLQSEVEELKAAQCIQKNLKNLQKRVADDAEEHLDKELATAQTQIIVQNLKLREAQTKLEQENKDNIQEQHFKIAELEIKLTQNLGPEYSKQAEFHLQEATRVMDSLKDTLDLDELRHKALKSRKRRMQLVFDDAEPPAKR